MKRPVVSSDLIWAAVSDVEEHMRKTLLDKGDGAFASTHEMLGTITEEYQELIEAVRHNNPGQVKQELKDLAVLTVFSIACLKLMEIT